MAEGIEKLLYGSRGLTYLEGLLDAVDELTYHTGAKSAVVMLFPKSL